MVELHYDGVDDARGGHPVPLQAGAIYCNPRAVDFIIPMSEDTCIVYFWSGLSVWVPRPAESVASMLKHDET